MFRSSRNAVKMCLYPAIEVESSFSFLDSSVIFRWFSASKNQKKQTNFTCKIVFELKVFSDLKKTIHFSKSFVNTNPQRINILDDLEHKTYELM